MSVRIRSAAPEEALDVRRILDAAMLQFDDLDRRIGAGDVLVAVEADGVRGAAVLAPTRPDEAAEGSTPEDVPGARRRRETHLTAIAVRRRHRGRGIGTALVETALDREGQLTARFDESVTSFYESLGFDVSPIDDGRYEGRKRR